MPTDLTSMSLYPELGFDSAEQAVPPEMTEELRAQIKAASDMERDLIAESMRLPLQSPGFTRKSERQLAHEAARDRPPADMLSPSMREGWGNWTFEDRVEVLKGWRRGRVAWFEDSWRHRTLPGLGTGHAILNLSAARVVDIATSGLKGVHLLLSWGTGGAGVAPETVYSRGAEKLQEFVAGDPGLGMPPRTAAEEIVPMFASSAAYAAVASLPGGWTVPFFSGLNEAHGAAMEAGMSNDQAMLVAIPAGILYALVERAQVKGLHARQQATVRQALRVHSNKRVLDFLARTGRGALQRFMREGTEEALQKLITEAGPIIMGKEDWEKFGEEVWKEFLAGGMMGVVLGAPGGVLDAQAQKKLQQKLIHDSVMYYFGPKVVDRSGRGAEQLEAQAEITRRVAGGMEARRDLDRASKKQQRIAEHAAGRPRRLEEVRERRDEEIEGVERELPSAEEAEAKLEAKVEAPAAVEGPPTPIKTMKRPEVVAALKTKGLPTQGTTAELKDLLGGTITPAELAKARADRSDVKRQRAQLTKEVEAYWSDIRGTDIESAITEQVMEAVRESGAEHDVFVTSFAGPLPTELKDAMAGQGLKPGLLKANVRGALGEDFVSAVGGYDEYVRLLKMMTESREAKVARVADEVIDLATQQENPEMAFKAMQLRALQDADWVGTENVVARRLKPGDTFTLNEETYTVKAKDETGVLVEDGVKGYVNEDATIPIDKGSLKEGAAQPPAAEAAPGEKPTLRVTGQRPAQRQRGVRELRRAIDQDELTEAEKERIAAERRGEDPRLNLWSSGDEANLVKVANRTYGKVDSWEQVKPEARGDLIPVFEREHDRTVPDEVFQRLMARPYEPTPENQYRPKYEALEYHKNFGVRPDEHIAALEELSDSDERFRELEGQLEALEAVGKEGSPEAGEVQRSLDQLVADHLSKKLARLITPAEAAKPAGKPTGGVPSQKVGWRLSPDSRRIYFNEPGSPDIFAAISRVPGPKGTGAWTATVNVEDRKHPQYGERGPGRFYASSEQAAEGLRSWLTKMRLPGIGVSKLQGTLSYGGSWAPGALEKQAGYDAAEHDRYTSELDKIESAVRAAAEEAGKGPPPPAFGAVRPQHGNWITEQDATGGKLSMMVQEHGDFWLVLKWEKRARQEIKASAFAKHHDKIVADAEVGGDYLREVFVRERPFEDIAKAAVAEKPPAAEAAPAGKPGATPAAEGAKTITGYHTTLRSPSGFIQRSAGTYIALDKPFQPDLGEVSSATVDVVPNRIFDPNGLIEGTDAERSRQDFDRLITELNRRSDELAKGDPMRAMSELRTEILQDMGYDAEAGWVDGPEGENRELVVFNRKAVRISKPAAEAKPAEAEGETDLFGRPVVRAISGKTGELGLEPGEIKEAAVGEIAVKPELVKEANRQVTAAGFGMDTPEDLYLAIQSEHKGEAPKFFNNPQNPMPEIREAFLRATKGGTLFEPPPVAEEGKAKPQRPPSDAAAGAVSEGGGGYGTIAPSPGAGSKGARQRPSGRTMQTVQPSVVKRALDDLLQVAAPARRGETARAGARVLRKELSALAHDAEVARNTLRSAHRAFTFMQRDRVFDFIDRMENGQPQATPKLDVLASQLRKILDGRRVQIQALGRGQLEHYYENYFPHIWKNPQKAQTVIAQILGRRPLQGSKAFLKKRSIMTIKEGRQYGLNPVSNNPVDLVLLKVHEMDRYLMAQRIIRELRGRGMVTFVYARSRTPEGYAAINDRAFTVYMPPKIGIKEAYDRLLVDNLMGFAQALGIDARRFMKLPGQAWGRAQGGKLVQTKFGGPEGVLIHEIGHVLGARYRLFDWITQKNDRITRVIKRGPRKGQTETVPNPAGKEHRKTVHEELRALADARYEGQEVAPGFKQYVRQAVEKEAVLLEALLHTPKILEQAAPTVAKLFKQFLNDHTELRPLLDISPSLVLSAGEGEVAVPGVTELGKFCAPEPIATLINNHLSPGLRNSRNKLIGGAYNMLRMGGNVLRQAEVALSAFHGFNTTMDVMGTRLGLGLRALSQAAQYLATGRPVRAGRLTLSALKQLSLAPVSPFGNLWRGNKLIKAYRTATENIGDPKLRAMIDAVVAAGGRGRMDVMYHTGAAKALTSTLSDLIRGSMAERVAAGVKLPFQLPFATLDVLAKPIMEWLVPRQKLGAFAVLARHEMMRHETENLSDEKLHESLTGVWDNVDNRMGQLVYANLFWNKTLKDTLMLGVRSVGWNLGSFREFLGAAVDVFTTPWRVAKGDAIISHRMGYTMGVAAVYGTIGSVLMYLMTGRGPDELKDYFFPKTGKKNPDGSDERLSIPSYAKDWWAWSQRPGQTLRNKLNPVWSRLGDLFANSDFYGTEIRHKDDPAIQQLMDVAEYVGNSFLPFSVRNYQKMRRTGYPTGEAALKSATGVVSAPAYLTRSPAQLLMTRYIIDHIPRGTRTKEEFELSQLRKQIIQKLRNGQPVSSEDMAKFSERGQAYIERKGKMTPFAGSFQGLPFGEALNVYTIATEAERRQVLEILDGKYQRAKADRPGFAEEEALYRELVDQPASRYGPGRPKPPRPPRPPRR
ncbi:MAG TPA: hypothetical protein VM223_08740 [Planctomycetota bacterium]|nr:hypothetical protein [Planctomycetota bacterium]